MEREKERENEKRIGLVFSISSTRCLSLKTFQKKNYLPSLQVRRPRQGRLRGRLHRRRQVAPLGQGPGRGRRRQEALPVLQGQDQKIRRYPFRSGLGRRRSSLFVVDWSAGPAAQPGVPGVLARSLAAASLGAGRGHEGAEGAGEAAEEGGGGGAKGAVGAGSGLVRGRRRNWEWKRQEQSFLFCRRGHHRRRGGLTD